MNTSQNNYNKQLEEIVTKVLNETKKQTEPQIQVSSNNSTPGALLTKFINDTLKFNSLTNDEQSYPKVAFVSKTNRDKKTDKKVNDINQKILELNNQKSEAQTYKEEQLIEQKIKKEKVKLNQLNKYGFEGEDIIEVEKFKFVKDFINEAKSTNIENIINNIYDPELRGYLDVANKTKFDNKTNALKKIVEKTNNVVHDRTTIFKEKMIEILSDENKFKIKVFNSVFEHPVQVNNNKEQKVYLLKSCEYMDSILKHFKDGYSKAKIYNWLLKQETGKHKEIADFASNFDMDSLFEKEMPEWIKNFDNKKENSVEVKRQLKFVFNILKKNISFCNFLEKYNKDNIIEHYNEYVEICAKIKNLRAKVTKCFENDENNITIEQVISQYITILKELKSIKNNSESIKFDEIFVKEFKSKVPFKMSKKLKEKIEYWVNNETDFDPEIENENNFNEQDFESITTPNKDIYNKELYAKFGYVAGLNLPKHVRIAIGLRCVSEIFKNIQELLLKHNNKHNFTVYILI